MLLLVLTALFPAIAGAQAPVVVGDSVRVVAGARYEAGRLHRFLFGRGWRHLWTTEIRVPVLDLGRTAGGLRPIERGGGFQTRSLEMAGADGRAFRFRSVDKDPSHSLPVWVRAPGVVEAVRDQTSALHPAAALVAAELARVAAIPRPTPYLVWMPDAPRLGPFRAEFGGMLGILEERPSPTEGNPDPDGFRRVVDTDTLHALLQASGDRGAVDSRAYLSARLLDFFLNDWDRHEGNWLWGTRDSQPPRRWLAIPKDRDQAFANYGGAIVAVVRAFVPKLLPLTTDYRLPGLTVNARTLDAAHLDGLPPPVWDSVAIAVAARLTDGAIEQALRAMPEAYHRLSREELTATLRARRAGLPAAARAWARMLAEER